MALGKRSIGGDFGRLARLETSLYLTLFGRLSLLHKVPLPPVKAERREKKSCIATAKHVYSLAYLSNEPDIVVVCLYAYLTLPSSQAKSQTVVWNGTCLLYVYIKYVRMLYDKVMNSELD